MKPRISLIFLGLTLFLFGISLHNIQSDLSINYNDHVVEQVKAQTREVPTHISVPSVGIDQQIKPGGIVDGKWILSDKYVHYVTFDPKDNEFVYYAHERKNLFVTLQNISLNDRVIITNQDGTTAEYTVKSIERIKPTDVNAVKNLNPNEIALYTCDGVFDQNRLLVKATFVK